MLANVCFGVAILIRKHQLDSAFRGKFEEKLHGIESVSDASGVNGPTEMRVYSDQDAIENHHQGRLAHWWHGPSKERARLVNFNEAMKKIKNYIKQTRTTYMVGETDSLLKRWVPLKHCALFAKIWISNARKSLSYALPIA